MTARPAMTAPWYPGANGGVSFSLNPPLEPVRGHFWWDGTTLRLFDGVVWVEVAGPPGPMGPSGPAGPPGASGTTDPAVLLQQNPTFLNGGTLSRLSPSTIGVAPCSCASSSGAAWIRMPGPANLVKDLTQAWAPGNAGGMGVGVIQAPNTWYHVFAAQAGALADAFIDTSVAGANAPSAITAVRRIGSIHLNAASQLFDFQQNGDMFTWVPGTDSINIISQVLVAAAAQASQFMNRLVPPGVQTASLLIGSVDILSSSGTQNFQAVMYPTFMGALTPASFGGFLSVFAIGQGGQTAFDVQVMTDANQLIGLGYAATAAQTQVNINCRGYIDTRGKL